MVFYNRLSQTHGGSAASLTVAEQYVGAFNKLARTNNTLILPSNVGDVSSLVGQAFSIYNTISRDINTGKEDIVEKSKETENKTQE